MMISSVEIILQKKAMSESDANYLWREKVKLPLKSQGFQGTNGFVFNTHHIFHILIGPGFI